MIDRIYFANRDWVSAVCARCNHTIRWGHLVVEEADVLRRTRFFHFLCFRAEWLGEYARDAEFPATESSVELIEGEAGFMSDVMDGRWESMGRLFRKADIGQWVEVPKV